ncbi:Replication termination factor 2 [Malassezia equina]|uniref:Replication termination factor 2 n=1 Tax=Malassezia equina TaxID=1381935 RepID=A0AAF0IYV2_9BASI|nr:Replication termination factor 2 [Malassezia equina]
MGNDGGSIARRDDLVRTRAQAPVSQDRDELRHSVWTLCRVSRHRLQAPVMVDRLGQLYNKEGLIEYLLRRSKHTATEAENLAARHIRGLKDVRPVTLTPNPVRESERGEALYYPYACPLTQRPMNGKHKFVALWTCGCVLSEVGLRETAFPGAPRKEPAALWHTTPTIEDDVVTLYPSSDTQQALREQLVTQRKKRKASAAAPESLKRTSDTEADRLKRARSNDVHSVVPSL